MLRSRWIATLGGGLLSAAVFAAEPGISPPRLLLGTPQVAPDEDIVLVQQKDPPVKLPEKKEEKKDAAPAIDFAQAPPSEAEAPTGLNPHMIGDFPGAFTSRLVTVDSTGRFIFNGTERIVRIPGTRTVRVPIPGGGAFKISENETVMPTDRFAFSFNRINDLQGPTNGSDRPIVRPALFPVLDGNQTVLVPGTLIIPGVATPVYNQSRQALAVEKSFLDGAFSVGVRAPFFQQSGDDSISDFGNLTFIFKYAAYRDVDTGTGISVGLALTTPTGPEVESIDGPFNSTYIQPFVGYILRGDRFFINGFTALAVPTESQDLTLLFNDIGLGYWMYRGDGFVTGLAPTIEAHITTPLTHRNDSDPVTGVDLVVLTGGVHIGLGSKSLLTLGIAVPVTGPRVFDTEAVVQFNYRFYKCR